jgi:hypothetical protein
MANYSNIGIVPMPFTADADLTAKQWMLVSPASTAGNVVATSSACNPVPLGILVNDPSAGQGAEVVIFGPTKAKCRVTTCDLKNGRFLKAASDGFLEAAAVEASDFAFADTSMRRRRPPMRPASARSSSTASRAAACSSERARRRRCLHLPNDSPISTLA